MKAPRIASAAWIAAVALSAAILVRGCPLVLSMLMYYRVVPAEFERASWVSATGHADPTRYRMALWLLDTSILAGRDRAAVHAMLGDPTPDHPFGGRRDGYSLRLRGIDVDWLVVTYDAADCVERVSIEVS